MAAMVVSVGKAPGATTVAAGIALAATQMDNQTATVVELDPAGGDLAAWWDLGVDPGVGSLASKLTIASSSDTVPVLDHAHSHAAVAVVPAPLHGAGVAAMCEDIVIRISQLDCGGALTVFDGGRWNPATAVTDRITIAPVIALVAPDLSGVQRAQSLLAAMAKRTEIITVAVMGNRPYGRDEVAAALPVDNQIVLEIPWDPKAAADVVAGRWTHRLNRSVLGRTLAQMAQRVGSITVAPGVKHV